MKLWKNILFYAALSGAFVSCQDLDIPPKNILSNTDIYTEGGITAYMAGLYNHLPMEDFNMGDDGARGGFFNWNSEKTTLGSTGEFANNNCGNSCVYGDKGYWKPAYQIIRQCNILIEDLPNYALDEKDEWIAEARFVRAYTYFALVKRYGGVPILTVAQNQEEDLLLARSSHQESIDFILKDLDYAIANMTTKKVNGRGNKYVAAALKSRVALYAGSVARYGGDFSYTSPESGTMLMGIPAASANQYFQQAYDASKVVDEGGYSLLTDGNKRQAFYDVFGKAASSPESIFIREYDANNYVHSWDKLMTPERWTGGYGNRYFVPLDWVELFDGLPLHEETGRLKTTDEDGNYIVYNNNHEIFDNAEPRLRASIMIPGDHYKGYELDMRIGLLINCTPDQKIKKRTLDDGVKNYSWDNGLKEFYIDEATKKSIAVRSTKKNKEGEVYKIDGKETGILIAGLDGPTTSNGNCCTTGIYGVKWLNRDQHLELHKSTQPWIDIRYAEVLLNRAEAAIELAQNGGDAALLNDAFDCINKVRERAGADLLTSVAQLADMSAPTNVRGTGKASWIFAPTKGLHVVRVERYKELAVEHKLYWDLRRWFTAHEQMRNFRWREFCPYMFFEGATKDATTGIPYGKYIIDTRVCDSYGGEHNFDSKYYYEKIPDSERKVNHLLEQNNRY